MLNAKCKVQKLKVRSGTVAGNSIMRFSLTSERGECPRSANEVTIKNLRRPGGPGCFRLRNGRQRDRQAQYFLISPNIPHRA